MRKYLILLFLLFAINVWGQRPNPRYRKLKTIYADLNNDGQPDTITLSSSLKAESFFNKITIILSGSHKRNFIAKDSWTLVDKWFLDSNKNASNSNLVFLKKTKKQSVILLFGKSYGSGERGEFSIINIENNNIRMVFDDDGKLNVELPATLISLKNDDRLDFIYSNIHEDNGELKNAMIGTYSPFFVYPVKDTCELNKPLMKKYNEEHYVFAGYKNSDKVRILYPKNDAQPRIFKIKRTE